MHVLQDHGHPEVGEDNVEIEVAQVASAALSVAGRRLRPGGEARQRDHGAARDHQTGRPAIAAALRPVHLEGPDVRQRVAQRRHLPVEDGSEVALPVDDGVVQPVVAVDDSGVALGGHGGGEPALELLQLRQLPRLHPGDLVGEAAQLPLDVALRPAEVGEPRLGGVQRVQARQRIDQLLAQAASLALIEATGDLLGVGRHQAVDVLHHVEGRVDDGGVLADGEGARYGHRGAGQRRDDAELPLHVVGARLDM